MKIGQVLQKLWSSPMHETQLPQFLLNHVGGFQMLKEFAQVHFTLVLISHFYVRTINCAKWHIVYMAHKEPNKFIMAKGKEFMHTFPPHVRNFAMSNLFQNQPTNQHTPFKHEVWIWWQIAIAFQTMLPIWENLEDGENLSSRKA
jgi:hypothetical protein